MTAYIPRVYRSTSYFVWKISQGWPPMVVPEKRFWTISIYNIIILYPYPISKGGCRSLADPWPCSGIQRIEPSTARSWSAACKCAVVVPCSAGDGPLDSKPCHASTRNLITFPKDLNLKNNVLWARSFLNPSRPNCFRGSQRSDCSDWSFSMVKIFRDIHMTWLSGFLASTFFCWGCSNLMC